MVSIIAFHLSLAATIVGVSFQDDLSLPLLDKMKATLTANIDGTRLNGYIQEYVQKAVDRKVKAAHEYTVYEINGLKTKIDSLVKAATIVGVSFQDDLSLPLLDKMKATLTANIDGTRLNGYIQEYVQKAVDRKVKAAHEYTVYEINGLKTKIDSLVKETKSTAEKNSKKLKSESQKLEKRIEELKVHQSGAETRSQYAFYAYMSHDEPNPGGNRIMVYDKLITNIGHSYNNFTGVFTVPKDGTYSFTWITRVACHSAYTTDLILNVNVIGSTYAYCGYNTVTGHVVTHASKGDALFVRTHSKSPGKGPIKSNEFGRSVFSGFLI